MNHATLEYRIMTRYILILAISTLSLTSYAQQNVGIGTASPDSSAVLDLTSTDKGVLVPRMSASQRQAISSPAIGLMVYDTTNMAFYYFTGNGWLELLAGSVDKIADADGDTKIQVEESPDENIIRFDLGGTERFVFDGPHIYLNGSEGSTASTFLGYQAGLNDDLMDNENVFIGYQAGQENTSGGNNVAVGASAMPSDTTGGYNTSVGWYTMNNATNVSNSTALGSAALRDNIDGGNNVAVGSQALVTNQSGNNNVAVGTLAGQLNQGSGNVFLGRSAGKNETGSNLLYIDNSATTDPLIYGDFSSNLLRINGTLNINNAFSLPLTDGSNGQVLQTNGSGTLSWVNSVQSTIEDADGDTKIQVEESPDENKIRFDMAGTEYFTMEQGRLEVRNANETVCIGDESGNTTMSGAGNTFMGRLSGNANTSGYGNVGIGRFALQYDTSGASNVALGGYALRDLKNGNSNVSIGTASLQDIASGENNVAVGFRAGGSATGSGNVFLGKYAGRYSTGDNKLFIENTDVDSTGALIYGEFDNDLLRINGSLNMNGAFTFPVTDGTASQLLMTDGSGNVSWAHLSSLVDSNGDTKIQVEESADENKIRFDLGGDEMLVMEKGSNGQLHLRIPVVNHSIQLGDSTGFNSTTDNLKNVHVGYKAGKSNTSGQNNVYIGALTGESNMTGEENMYLGNEAGQLRTGSQNVCIGYGSGSGNTTSGNQNTIIGATAGYGSSGSGNVLIGFNAGLNITASNRLFIDNSATSTPLIYGEFNNDLAKINGELQVRDELSFGDGNYYPPAYDRKVAMVCGKVNSSGSLVGTVTSSNWINTVTRNSEGKYTITFDANTFTDEPIVTVTGFYDGANYNRFPVIESVVLSGNVVTLNVDIRNQNGDLKDGPFNFIAVGER